MENIFIYKDKGADEFSYNELKQCLESFNFKIETVNANAIKNGILFESDSKLNAKLLCIGGGRDLDYLEMLGDEGCSQIKKFVQNGGNYLGICAGAYFACDYIEFDLNGPLEVKGERKLKFFNGKATGPINKTFKYNTESEAMAVEVKFYEQTLSMDTIFYLNGGCNFIPNDSSTHQVIAEYSSNNSPAIINCSYGKGICILSGLHIEYDPSHLNKSNENIRLNVLPKLTYEAYALLKALLTRIIFKKL